MLPKEDKTQKSYVFYFNKCFVSAGLVIDARENLAQMSSQIKMKEEDSVEEFNPWNKDVKLLEKMLNSHDSIMKEGKDVKAMVRNQQPLGVTNQQQFEELVDSSNNLK